MNMKAMASSVLLAIGTTGCLSAPFQPPPAAVTAYSAPLSTEGNWKIGSKTGSAEAVCILGLVAVGDCSLNTAAANGGLKEVHYADYKYVNILGIYQCVTVSVTGD